MTIEYDENGNESLGAPVTRIQYHWDTERVVALTSDIQVAPPTRTEAADYFLSQLINPQLAQRVDTEDYTFLHIWQSTTHGGTTMLVRITNDGEYYNYSRDFRSVSLYGNINFDKVEIDKEKETVLIHYDTDYLLDLKTGVLTKINL